jgi:hypothetical protein
MSDSNMAMVRCDISMGEAGNPFGVYANAFRIVPDNEHEVFLDFCIYSAHTNTAQVVARIRVATAFLPTVQERIARDVGSAPLPRNTVFLMTLPGSGGEN